MLAACAADVSRSRQRHRIAAPDSAGSVEELEKLVAKQYQDAIAHLMNLDLIPPQWLHITMQEHGRRSTRLALPN